MAELTTSSLDDNQRMKLLVQTKIEDTFKERTLNTFNAFSPDIVKHLSDYFMLVHDLKVGLKEDHRKIYFDYGFVLFPLHKAFECYLNKFMSFIFKFEISKKTPIGVYLSYPDPKKKEILGKMKKLPWGKKISIDKWISTWNALAEEWQTNRNPLTHPEQERIHNLTKAEQIAGAITRKIEVSFKLFANEYIDTLIEMIKTEEKKELEKKKELASKIG